MADPLMILQPYIGESSPHHRAYVSAHDELEKALIGLGGEPRSGADPDKGAKGGSLHEIAVLLTSTSVSASVVAVVKIWLSRDRRRKLDIRLEREDEAVQKFHIEGDMVSLDLLEVAIRAALKLEHDHKQRPGKMAVESGESGTLGA